MKGSRHDTGRRTGWPPALLQDDSRGLFSWFASKPDARRLVRERAAEIRNERRAPHGI